MNPSGGVIEIDYPGSGNKSEFVFNCTGNWSKIIETAGGSLSSVQQFVWCNSMCCEERDASGALNKVFSKRGQTVSGSKYFFTRDQIGSVREMSDNSGAIQSQYQYDSYGKRITIAENVPSDFSYASMFLHSRSKLNLTLFRAYNPDLSIWLSRDPSSAGGNLMRYANNNPICLKDSLGLYADVSTDIGDNGVVSINIDIPIRFSGVAQTKFTYDFIRESIAQWWTGRFGNFCVHTTVRMADYWETKVNNINFTNDLVDGGLKLHTPPGEYWDDWNISAWKLLNLVTGGSGWAPAHEAGHMIGLEDDTGGIMGSYSYNVRPTPGNMAEIFNMYQ